MEEVLRIEDLAISQNEDAEEAEREEALKKELEGVRNLNNVMEGVIAAMSKAKENMDTVGSTVENADRLLDIWIKVLSQAEHTQRLLLDGQWQGASEDARAQEELLRLESEAAAAASRAAELAKQKAAEAAEKAKLEAASRTAAKTPTRGRGILKNGSVPTTSTRGRGLTSQTTGSVRGRGAVGVGRGSTRGTTSTSTTRGSVRGRGSLVRS